MLENKSISLDSIVLNQTGRPWENVCRGQLSRQVTVN